MRQFLIVLLIVGLANTAWAEDEHPATDAVKAYVEAFLTIDYEAIQAVLCEADLEIMDQTDFEQALETVTALNYTADFSEIAYDTLELDEMLVEVTVTGDISLEIESKLQPVIVTPPDLKLERIWAVYEDESWKACSQVPPDMIDTLEPDVIARIFMEAAYKGNYEEAHSLVCEAQQETLSEIAFDQLFGQFLKQDVQFNFHDTVFEITEQTEENAVVALTGDILLTIGERPSPVAVPVENIGMKPVNLRYEDGWKICN